MSVDIRTIAQVHSKGKCLYCGQKNISITIDHVLPKAVFKWNLLPEEQANDNRNIFICCVRCNKEKGAKIVSEKFLRGLNISKALRHNLIDFFNENQLYIDNYMTLLKKKYAEQNNKCFVCNQSINVKNTNLRRISLEQERTYDNSVVVCNNCNKAYMREEEIEGE